MRLGDWILVGNLTLNVLAMVCYGIEGYWKMVGYWACVAGLNSFMIAMK